MFQTYGRGLAFAIVDKKSRLIRAPIPGTISPSAKQSHTDAWHQAISKANKKPAEAG